VGSDNSTQDSHPITHLGRYQVLGHIASGAMGAVYRALDPVSRQEVALKVLLPKFTVGKPAAVDRFRQEALLGAKLRHENIVTLHEFGVAEDTYFLVMELVEGVPLSDYLQEHGPLGVEEARHVLTQIVRALQHAHAHGLVHRDIKPANILLTLQGGRSVAKLADFGLARVACEEDFRLTREGFTVGTVDYMAPEQARDSTAADIRSDLYSLGCTFYHMLTGQPPFSQGTLTERLFRHAEAEPPDARLFNPDIPPGLIEVLRRMLAKRPADRYQTPEELLNDLLPRQRPSRRAPAAAQAMPSEETAPAGAAAGARAGTASGRIAAGQFEWAREQLARGNRAYAVQLLLACCRLDPANLDYHKALRQALKARDALGRGGWFGWLGRLVARFKLRLARRARAHLRVLALGAELLVRNPADLKTQLVMAAAAEGLGAMRLAVWLLEEARRQDSDSAVINRALGRCYEVLGDYDRAVASWEEVARVVPRDSEATGKLRDLTALQALQRNRERQKGDGRRRQDGAP
jgi:tRNA A-37 threonylcarbamoyl transferase component Bud32/tetratricopeptide (TPR) repeat protein